MGQELDRNEHRHASKNGCGHGSKQTDAASLTQHGVQVSVPDPATFLKAKIHISINRIMATYLSNLEELADEHDEAMGKLIDTLPPEHKAKVALANVYGEARFDAIRKHVLFAGNSQTRELNEVVEFLRIKGDDE